MVENRQEKKQHRRWLQILIAALCIVAVLFIIKGRHDATATTNTSKGELKKMLGFKGKSPKSLDSYQSVEGVLDIQHWVTEQGVRVYFVRVPTLPMVDIKVTFDAGAARNGDKGGLAYITNALLADGTAQLSSDQVAEDFENVGAQFNAESQRDMAIISLRSLSSAKELIPAVDTLGAILAAPSFPEQAFKREQQNALSSLKQQAQTPSKVANRAFYNALYPNAPYSNWILGDEKAINALTLEEVKAFHKKYYVAKNAVVTLVGDLSLEDANGIVHKLTSQLPEGEKAPALPEVAPLSASVVNKMEFPSAQTHILVGQPVMKQGDPDYYPLYLGNHILGGNGSVTRIFNIVRNQHGLAYSAYSAFIPMHEKGPFVLGCQTRNDKADEALKLIENLLKEFVAQGPTESELAAAKQNLLGGYALQFDSNASISQQVAALGFYGLPLNYFNQFKASIEKVTIEDIKKAYQQRITPDKMAVVMVGGKGASPAVDAAKPLPHGNDAGGTPSGAQI